MPNGLILTGQLIHKDGQDLRSDISSGLRLDLVSHTSPTIAKHYSTVRRSDNPDIRKDIHE